MRAHRSIRRYLDVDVPDDVVNAAVHAAQGAATSSNVQGYSLLRVRDADTRARLAELCGDQDQVREVGAFFCVCADQRRHELLAEALDRPHVANLETFLVDTIDAALFAQNLALAFEASELGTCFIGGLRTRLPEVLTLLEIPRGVFPLFGLCVGTPAEDPGSRPRLPLSAVLHEERYPEDAVVLDQVAQYDREMAAYYEARGRPGWNWSDGLTRKLERPAREHLHDTYTGLGAVLR